MRNELKLKSMYEISTTFSFEIKESEKVTKNEPIKPTNIFSDLYNRIKSFLRKL